MTQPAIQAIPRVTIRDRIWMAAILDTKGKIRFTNDVERKTNQLVLQVQSQRTDMIARLARLTGTAVQARPAHTIDLTRRPCTEHCDQAHSHVFAEVPETSLWSISGVGAAIVLHNLLPDITHVSGLAVVVDNVFDQLPSKGRGRSAVDQTIIRLRKIGWYIPPAALTHFVGTPVTRGFRGRFVAKGSAC